MADGHALPDALRGYPVLVESELERRFHGLALPGISPGLEYQLASGGKRLRPALTLWWCRALGGRQEHALPFALAVELLHGAFLIHDDIEDGDRTRRGRPTLWVAQGIEVAINVADYMLAMAQCLVGETPLGSEVVVHLHRIFASTFLCTVEGQALDLEYRGSPDLTMERYEEIIRKKTGRYLALGWVGGALIAGRPLPEAEALWQVGEELGPAFQIRDDLLDLTGAKGRDDIGCDIREGKPSILVACALASSTLPGDDRERMLRVLACPREQTEDADVAWVTDLFERCGAVASARAEALRRAQRSLAGFRQLSFIPGPALRELEEIAAFIAERRL